MAHSKYKMLWHRVNSNVPQHFIVTVCHNILCLLCATTCCVHCVPQHFIFNVCHNIFCLLCATTFCVSSVIFHDCICLCVYCQGHLFGPSGLPKVTKNCQKSQTSPAPCSTAQRALRNDYYALKIVTS